MKRIICVAIIVCLSLTAFSEDFYLPLTGYSIFDKATKKTDEKKMVGICCLIEDDMFIMIDKIKFDCQSVESIDFQRLSNNTSMLVSKCQTSINCSETLEMKIVLNFVNDQLTNIYLFGESADYEFYLE
ncbi:MAG: hypothetical protein J6P95_06520 [Paludibacteraceae bacterium]|nr:hypothetical protein [Paludibacteraceae bacterium]